jgi:segregation and condensation protein B
MYGTTTLFLERIGIDTLQELPNLSDFVPDAEVAETLEAVLRGDDEVASGTEAEADSQDMSPPT